MPGAGNIADLAFTPDGRHLITANGAIYVLRIDEWQPLNFATKETPPRQTIFDRYLFKTP